MIVAFVESIKYVGHLLPVAFLRVFIGYLYVNHALLEIGSGTLRKPHLANGIRAFLPRSLAPDWYRLTLETMVLPHWRILAYAVVTAQLLVGISYLLGYLVRPMSLLGVILVANSLLALGGLGNEEQSNVMLILHIVLGWLGAGRCLGFDYYFYKRRRGIWW